MCLLRSALISLFCKYRPACFILITPFWAPVYHYLLWSVSPAVLINIILAYFENVGGCDLFAIQQHYFFFLKKKKKTITKFKVMVSPRACVCVWMCVCELLPRRALAQQDGQREQLGSGVHSGVASVLCPGELRADWDWAQKCLCPVVSLSALPRCQPRPQHHFVMGPIGSMLLRRPLLVRHF